jgi:uncharacterized protein YneF (UPF0154 family)
MFSSAAAALSQMFEARFRGVLVLGIGLWIGRYIARRVMRGG